MNVLINVLTIYLPILLIVLFAVRKNRLSLKLFLVLLATVAINLILKESFRIDGSFVTGGFQLSEFSFPSLSVQLATTFWGYLYFHYRKTVFLIIAGASIASVAYLKFTTGAHDLVDILGGFIVGILVIFAFSYFLKKRSKAENVRNVTQFYNVQKNWVHYLTRPFNLFGVSLWQAWYESKDFEELFGGKLTDVLCVEETRGQVRQYRIKTHFIIFGLKLVLAFTFKYRRAKKMLEEAASVNEQAKQFLHKGPQSFPNLEEAVNFLIKLAFYGTLLPSFPSVLIRRIPSGKMGKLIVKLRATSYYPRFTNEIVLPLAVERLKSRGVEEADKAINLITVKELMSGNVRDIIESRRKDKAEDKFFVYQQLGTKETVSWVSDPRPILFGLEPNLLPRDTEQVTGRVAFRGSVQGIVKIVKDYDSDRNKFEKGDILISPSTNPTMLPLMKMAGGIVADEGGITSHAAIVSRELKKPCIIGTKIATKIFKDGDKVEVDAIKGIVRKLG